jgi:hypothetical protein
MFGILTFSTIREFHVSWFLNCSEGLEIFGPGSPHSEGESNSGCQANDGANRRVSREFPFRIVQGVAIGLLEIMLHVLFRELSELCTGIFA